MQLPHAALLLLWAATAHAEEQRFWRELAQGTSLLANATETPGTPSSQGLGFRFPADGRRASPPLQAARGWAHPRCRHFKIQSCCCLGLAFELAAFQTPWVRAEPQRFSTGAGGRLAHCPKHER
jgi:hypothetical protein